MEDDINITNAEMRLIPYLCWTQDEIAEELCIEKSTVKTHIHHLIKKLNVANREEMLVELIKRGLLNVFNVKLKGR